jgi:hypothetical protein
MRYIIAMLLALFPEVGGSTTRITIIDDPCEENYTACLEKNFAALYDESDVIFEVTILSNRRPYIPAGRTTVQTVYEVGIRHVWKTDGKSIRTLAEVPKSTDGYRLSLKPGKTYVVFAHRQHGWLRHYILPLAAGDFAERSTTHAQFYNARTQAELDKLLKIFRR